MDITQQVRFADVSFYQGDINWTTYASSFSATIIRIGQGDWIDSKFHRNWTEAGSRNLLRGGYWFYDDRWSPEHQADLVALALSDYDRPEMEIYVDYERSYSGSFQGLSNVVKMMQAVEEYFPEVNIGIYTGYYWWKDHYDPKYADYLRDKALWLAWYTSNPYYVKVPEPWTEVTHWQYGTPAEFYGQETREIDMNWFNGTEAEFVERYTPLAPLPAPDLVEETQPGVFLHTIRRFSTDMFVHVIDPAKMEFHLSTPFGRVPEVAKNADADLAFNNCGWGLWSDPTDPNEWLIIDGAVVQTKSFDQRWGMHIDKEGALTFPPGQPNFSTSWNFFGFDRFIARGGQYNTAITSPWAEPRTVYGRNRDGHHVVLVCEGRRDNQKGLTFPEIWTVMQEFDCDFVGNADGGYSSCAVNRKKQEGPLNETYLVEDRSVVCQTLYKAKEGLPPPPQGEDKMYECTVELGTDERTSPEVGDNKTGKRFEAGETWQTDVFIEVSELEAWVGTPDGHYTAQRYPRPNSTQPKVYVRVVNLEPPAETWRAVSVDITYENENGETFVDTLP